MLESRTSLIALASVLATASAGAQGPVRCSPDPSAVSARQGEAAVAAVILDNCRLTLYALGDDGQVWVFSRNSPDRSMLPEATKWRDGWSASPSFGTGIASAPSIARSGAEAVALVDGTVSVDGKPIGGNARHSQSAGNAPKIFYARPFILNWWPNHDPKLGSEDAEPTHTAVFLWWADGYLYYRTRADAKGVWSKWVKLPQARVYSDPSVVARLRQPYLDVFAQGEKNTLVHWTWNGDKWLFDTVPMARPASAPTALIGSESSLYGINTTAENAGKWSCAGRYGDSTFRDLGTGRCWSCPAGFNRTVWQPIGRYARGKWTGIPNGCEKGGFAGIGATISAATHHGVMGCPAGSFRNGLTDDCYRCPGRGQRTIVPANDLTKLADACRQTVWGTFSVAYRGVSGQIERANWDLDAENNRHLKGRDIRRGWWVDTIALPKEFATTTSAPVVADMTGWYLFARNAKGEFLSVALGMGDHQAINLGAPRQPAPGTPEVVEIFPYVVRFR